MGKLSTTNFLFEPCSTLARYSNWPYDTIYGLPTPIYRMTLSTIVTTINYRYTNIDIDYNMDYVYRYTYIDIDYDDYIDIDCCDDCRQSIHYPLSISIILYAILLSTLSISIRAV
ncbi:hypothetical protein CEXT_52741 [Caerostris extrusa]|uniref:Uncharacterized protein n=1 Tax=Caerostris extrusa TaxID=172846 RepID=A0AAV4TRC1_CAEEX|nr:hypothetical protein CEXT_52741 [Caerostris extrusa]